MRKQADARGFSTILVIITALVIVVIGIIGWRVQTKKDVNQSGSKTPQNINENSTPANGNNKYLDIKEWGVRITLPDNLRGDVSYFLNDKAQRDFGGPVLVDFISKKFSAGNLKCAVIEGDAPRSLVSIEQIDLNINPIQPTTYPQPFKTIGTHAYRFSTTSCEETINREGSATDKSLLASLKDAINTTLESDK